MKCIHSWGGYACGGNADGLLCYVPRGEETPRVDLSCERFMVYHEHHGGIIILVAWELEHNESKDIVTWLRDNRDQFKQQVGLGIRPVPERGEIIDGALKNYDNLIEKLESQN